MKTKKPIIAATLVMILAVILRECGVPNVWFFLSSMEAVLFYAIGASYCNPALLEKSFACLYPVCTIVNIFSFIIGTEITTQKLDLCDAKLGAFPLSLLTAFAGIGMVLISAWYISKIGHFPSKILTFIGENSLFFFTLTAYIPGALESVWKMFEGVAGSKEKILFKFMGFLITTGIVLAYKGKKRNDRKEINHAS